MVCCLPLTHIVTHRQHTAALYTQHSVAMQFPILRYCNAIRVKNKDLSLILTIKYALLILYFAYSIFLSLEGFVFLHLLLSFYFILLHFWISPHLFCLFAFVNLKLMIKKRKNPILRLEAESSRLTAWSSQASRHRKCKVEINTCRKC